MKNTSSANPVKYFADKAIVVDTNEMVPKPDLYEAYKRFCKIADLTVQSNDSFSRDFGKLGFSYRQIQENKKKDRYWIGVKLADWLTVKDRDDAQQIFDEMEMSNDTQLNYEDFQKTCTNR
jgi:hypothetical protein